MRKSVLGAVLCLAVVPMALAGSAGQDLIRLAQSGVDGEVLLAYVESSAVSFELNADDIIILKDLGVPAGVIGAALRRDQALDSIAAAKGGRSAAAASEGQEGASASAQVAPPSGNLNISFFYDYLSPYGRWMLIDGDWCWQPNAVLVSVGWAPYYNHGRWVYTDWGWCWISDYSWGWAPFHYGRWFRHPRHGWCWWPDNVWGPAWVAWRHGHGYWGWAPIPRHHHYRHGYGWYRHNRRLRHGHDFGLTWSDYFYLPTRHVADPKPWVHIVPPERGREIFAKTSFDPGGFSEQKGNVFNRGPRTDEVAKETGKPVTPLTLVKRDLKPGQPITGGRTTPNGLEIYTPMITPDIPRPPVVTPPTGGQLPGIEKERLRDATRQALDRTKSDAERAERERRELIDKAKSEDDGGRQEQLRVEAGVRDQRARQAREDAVRLERWKPETAVPLPPAPERPKPPQVREEIKEQVRTEAGEEQKKRQALEDMLRKPAGQTQPPAKQEKQENLDDNKGSGRKGRSR
ncbi:MAG TPA: hypothetical protein DDW31_02385 [candidate division Zixibacteria bacterium]|nr:hypothetical protein [candidate division Zixibacteria bacterium]